MAKKIKNQKIIFICALIFVNLILLFSLFISGSLNFSSAAVNNPFCDNIEPTPINLSSIVIPYEIKCLGDCEQVTGGDTLFAYYGRDANLWGTMPYGVEGTFEAGGNAVLQRANKFEITGYDGSGMHWIMTDQAEPYGNAIGLKDKQEIVFGGNLIVNGDLSADKRKIILANNNMSARRYEIFEEAKCFSDGRCGGATVCIRGCDFEQVSPYDHGFIYLNLLENQSFDAIMSISFPNDQAIGSNPYSENNFGGYAVHVGDFSSQDFDERHETFTAYGLVKVHDQISVQRPKFKTLNDEIMCSCVYPKYFILGYFANKHDKNFIGYPSAKNPCGHICPEKMNRPEPLHYLVCPYGTEEWPGYVSCKEKKDCQCTLIEELEEE